MDSVLKHPWYRLHWFTWVVILIAGLSLIPAELQPRLLSSGTYVFGSIRTYSTELRYGWPLVHLDTVEMGPGFPAPIPSPSFTYKWNYSLLFVNLAFCSILISSTGFVAEKWLRKPHPTQFSIRSFLAITGVVGLLISLVANEQPIYQILGQSISYKVDLFNWYKVKQPAYWAPLATFGFMLFAIYLLILPYGSRILRLVRRRTNTSESQ